MPRYVAELPTVRIVIFGIERRLRGGNDSKRHDGLGPARRELKKTKYRRPTIARRRFHASPSKCQQDNVNTVENVRFEIPDCNPGNCQVKT